jgi:cyclic pyranopterin phosphate synthase
MSAEPAVKVIRLPVVGSGSHSPEPRHLADPSGRSRDLSDAPPHIPADPHDRPGAAEGPLADRFARSVRYLRLSVTDRCNYGCLYCRPEEGFSFRPRAELLTFEEMVRIVGVFAGLGVRRVRLTGGEPTVRAGIVDLVGHLAAVPGIAEVVMTSNGHLLPGLAAPLAAAGLSAVNVSIDTVDPGRFAEVTRGGDLERVVAGIDAAIAAGLEVKLNAVALRGVTDGDIAALCAFAWERGVVVRFIEHMPMSDGLLYDAGREVSAAAIRAAVEAGFGPLAPSTPQDPARGTGPARYWHLAAEPRREVGIISAMTEHFCDSCNRLRLTATGDLHACLGHDDALSLRDVLRAGGSDDDVRAVIWASVNGKRVGHEFSRTGEGGPRKHMIAIGG